jgi:sugar porter (SP) family MFS transporter
MERRNTFFIAFIALIAGFGGFMLGFDSSVMADIQDQVSNELSLTDWQWSQLVSMSLLGSLLGIPLSGFFVDRVSSHVILKAVAFSFILGALFCSFSSSFYALWIGRLFIGVCVGIASYVTPLFIAEIAPPYRRGSLLLVNGLTITFGQAIAYLVGYALHDYGSHSWRYLFVIGSIPGFVLFIGMHFVPQSPRWIIKKEGLDSARAILRRIRPTNYNIEDELRAIANQQDQTQKPLSSLLKAPILYVVLIGMALGLAQQCSGINAIMYYGPVIFGAAGFWPIKNAILATFVMGVINFLFTIITLLCVDKLGRRFLLLSGTMIATISLVAVNVLFNYSFPGQKFYILGAFALYIAGYCISVGSLFWVIISEIYPVQIRGLAMSLATVVQYLANFMVTLSFLKMYHALNQSIFSLLGVFCLFAFFLIYFFVPETTGVSLEQIEERLMARKKIREIGREISKKSTRNETLLEQ